MGILVFLNLLMSGVWEIEVVENYFWRDLVGRECMGCGSWLVLYALASLKEFLVVNMLEASAKSGRAL